MAIDAKAPAELAQDRAQAGFQRREWRVQRIGWVLLAACLAAACVGVFGGGPVARQNLVAGENHAEIDRFARQHSPEQWRFTAKRTQRSDAYVVRISSRFLERYGVMTITPAPTKTSIERRDVVFEFAAARADGTIVFQVEPQRAGLGQGELRLGDSRPLRVSQLVYP